MQLSLSKKIIFYIFLIIFLSTLNSKHVSEIRFKNVDQINSYLNSISSNNYSTEKYEILMPVRGHWNFKWDSGETVINPGDTVLVPPMLQRSISPNMTGISSMYRVRNTNDKAGPTVKK